MSGPGSLAEGQSSEVAQPIRAATHPPPPASTLDQRTQDNDAATHTLLNWITHRMAWHGGGAVPYTIGTGLVAKPFSTLTPSPVWGRNGGTTGALPHSSDARRHRNEKGKGRWEGETL
eukprot:TRINITY_DN13163_c0_g1_i1.p4 TRINITY_DN13163_c0_g1~~TRINITY_DN13163_c0_g1_i1.p4  ORF type:complete len:118 (-),score=0.16 TRINITY_DN13163_c0_g1_i1:326-679(-)